MTSARGASKNRFWTEPDARIGAQGRGERSRRWTCDPRGTRQTVVVRTYGQYCPIARAAEILAERWTPVIVRNLLLGCTTFSEIARGAPGISRTLLAQRLRDLERAGIVQRTPHSNRGGFRYLLTDAGKDLSDVVDAMGVWGARWLEVVPTHLDPGVALWSMCNAVRVDRLPHRRVVVRLEFRDQPRRHRLFWLVLADGAGEVCVKHPGFEEDLWIEADSEAFVKWHMGRMPWSRAIDEGRIVVHGPRTLARAFPTWNGRSKFASVRPRFPVEA